MRQITLAVLGFAMAGCTLPVANQRASAPDGPLTRADVREAKQIIVTVGESCAPARSWTSFRCVFQENGHCYGERTHYQEMSPSPERLTKVTHEFPPETFQQVKRILLDSKCLNLKSGVQGFIFESSKGVTVECGGHKLGVTWGQGDCEPCQPLMTYIEELLARAK